MDDNSITHEDDNFQKTPSPSLLKMPLRQKPRILVTIVGVVSGILSAFISPIIAGLITLFVFPSKPGDELGGIVSLFFVIPGVWLASAIFASYISFKLTHKWKYVLLGLLLHIVTIIIFYVVLYSFYKADEQERLEIYRQEFNQTEQRDRRSQ